MEASGAPRLLLEVADLSIELTPDKACVVPLSLGKAPDNDLVLEGEPVSRAHATIEYQHNDYYLVDASTNGTWIQSEDDAVTHVHRRRHRLWGNGWIALGAPLRLAHTIRFRQVLS